DLLPELQARAEASVPTDESGAAASPQGHEDQLPHTGLASDQPHDRLLAHQVPVREEVADGGDQPALGVDAERDLQTRAAVARRVWRIEIAEGGARRVERHDDLRIAGGAADLVHVAGGVPDEAALVAVGARDLADEQLEEALRLAERAR